MGMIQIRNVPDDLHRRLKSKAADSGQTLSDYILADMRRLAAAPTLEEMLDRLDRLPAVVSPETPADALKAEREARGAR